MHQPWHDSYPADVPHDIDPGRYRSILELIDAACSEFADRDAFTNFGSALTFDSLERHQREFAAWLQHDAGIQRGDRVALMMPNILAYPVALMGTLRAGAVVVNTNPQYTARELAHQLADSGARVIVIFENALGVLDEIRGQFPELRIVIARIGDFMRWPKAFLFNRISRRRAPQPVPAISDAVRLTDAVAAGADLALATPELGHDDLAFLQYTGGTTGRAKGAMLSHRNIIANILQANAWFGPVNERGTEAIITALPLYHVYALTANCLAFLTEGGVNHLITDPRNLKSFIRELRRVRFTAFTGVNTLFNGLLHHPDFAALDFSALKLTSGGGMAVQRPVAERWREVTGSVIVEGYGLTESSPVVTVNRYDADTFSGSIGLPVPSTEVRLLDDEGTPVTHGEAGELCVRGPQVMQGYWNNAEETATAIDADGWLRTGDIARMDEAGYLYIVDRKKDLIVVSGFNVYPNEIEEVIAGHPAVAEVAAIGIADERTGEAVRIVVVRSDDAVDEQTLTAYAREHLTGYKIPRSVVFTTTLPKTNVGKILRREVRELFGAA